VAETVKPRGLAWVGTYARCLFLSDLVIIAAAVFGSQSIRFGLGGDLQVRDATGLLDFALGYNQISAALVAAWMLSLGFFDTRDHKVIGSGSAEYKAVVDATVRIFGIFAVIVYLAQAQVGRRYLLVALPTGLVSLLLSRWLWRKWLIRRRLRGEYNYRALLLGQRAKVEHVAESIQRAGSTGLLVVGAVTDGGAVVGEGDAVVSDVGAAVGEGGAVVSDVGAVVGDGDAPVIGGDGACGAVVAGVPVLGGFGDVLQVVDDAQIDTLILTSADDITPQDMRRLGWDLESRRTSLIVVPALTDVAGPRIHARPVAGLPLIYVDYPTFEGRKHTTKRAFDILLGTVLLVLLTPVLLGMAIAVRRDSAGPAFFRQERVGFNGRLFRMVKFRSMIAGAEAMQASLLDQSDGNGVTFKLQSDPRVTRLGGVLRRYSLDELPQLFNVIGGSMSLVGPRPHPVCDVLNYEATDRRRLLVRPGMTGLWQVGGRSGLSWEESVRLDLYYVENWSMMGDLVILWRTVKAVTRPDAAY
jgi:lipopolysaccharide/colanic/teichoic acid biosynthesis glycosyltransferase